MVSAAVACSSSATPLYGAPAVDSGAASEDAGPDTSAVPLYGAPADSGDEDVSVAPLYGLPADGSVDEDGGDAGRDASPAPLYGGSPPE